MIGLETTTNDSLLVAQMWLARGGSWMDQHHINHITARPVVNLTDFDHINQTTSVFSGHWCFPSVKHFWRHHCWNRTVSPKDLSPLHSQLSISRVQFCSSRGYLLRSIMQAAVVVILKIRKKKIKINICYKNQQCRNCEQLPNSLRTVVMQID